MVTNCAISHTFVTTVAHWLAGDHEILIRTAHPESPDFERFAFQSSYGELVARLAELAPGTSVVAFRAPQLPIRGLASSSLYAKCLDELTNTATFLVLDMRKRRLGSTAWQASITGRGHDKLGEVLATWEGTPVAVGVYPRYEIDGPSVASTVIV